jgi:hypothetical protein
VAKAGSVLVQDSRLWHTGGVNTSDAVRTSVVVRYAPWWLSVEFGRTQVCAANNVVLFAPFYATNRFTKTGSGKNLKVGKSLKQRVIMRFLAARWALRAPTVPWCLRTYSSRSTRRRNHSTRIASRCVCACTHSHGSMEMRGK